jgi:hypothetical protein
MDKMEYRCIRCDKNFILKTDLKRHYNRKHICKNILKDYSKNELIKDYNEKYEKRYSCKKCNKIYYVKSELIEHLNNNKCNGIKNIIVKEYQCSKCGKYYKNKYSLDRHIMNVCYKNSGNMNIIINNNYNNCNFTNIRNNNIQNNLIINDFGKENIEYINTISYINELFNKYNLIENEDEELTNEDTNKINSVNLRDLMNDIYFNKEHKENNNIIPVNIKKGIYKVKIDDNYIKKDADLLFSILLEKIVFIYNLLLDKKINDDDKFVKIKENLIKLMEYIDTSESNENKNNKEAKSYINESKKVKNFLRKSLDMMASDYKENNHFNFL